MKTVDDIKFKEVSDKIYEAEKALSAAADELNVLLKPVLVAEDIDTLKKWVSVADKESHVHTHINSLVHQLSMFHVVKGLQEGDMSKVIKALDAASGTSEPTEVKVALEEHADNLADNVLAFPGSVAIH